MNLSGPLTPSAPVDLHDPPARSLFPPLLRTDGAVPVIVLPDDMPFDDLREWLRERVAASLDDIGGRACRLDLGAREIALFDLRRLIHLLRDTFGVDVTGLYVRAEAVHRYAERELKLKLFFTGAASQQAAPAADTSTAPATQPTATAARTAAPDDVEGPLPGLADLTALLADVDAPTDEQDPAPDAFEPGEALRRVPMPDIPQSEPEVDSEGGRRTLNIRRTLRSGSAIRYDGDVVVMGDVNAGAQIRAGGHVIVLGRLRGVVHAGANGGANGGDESYILAFDLAPTQLRIGRHIAIAPTRGESGDAFVPEIALVEGGAIIIEPYKGRLRRG